jgi:hypothetical protein
MKNGLMQNAASLTVSGSDGENDCYTDGTGYYVFDWEGGCLATLIIYSAGELDLSAYGFTSGFTFYGFEPGTTDDFVVFFGESFGSADGVINDCPAPETCEDQGLVTCDDGSCAATADDCVGSEDCAGYIVDMADAYGDGWNGNVLTIGDATFTIDDGAAAQGCYDGPSDVVVTCDGGSWQSEVSWTISDDSGVVLSGGAPYSGCLGTCDDDGSGGGDDCVNDDSTSDSYGDTCSSWYDANEGPGSGGCTGSYDDDDFNAAEQCCVCQGEAREGGSNNMLSQNDALNQEIYRYEIATYKKSVRTLDKPILATGTTVLNLMTMELTQDNTESNRDVSYTINVSCDTCLSGGPWSGAWEVGQSDFLVYGFDAGSNVCANVVGSSTELGSTEPSNEACADAGDQSACEFLDCTGAEACGYESWVGDGYCDDGTYGMYFDCDEFDCDAGDCLVECWDGSSACGAANCPEEPTCDAGDVNGDGSVNVTDIVSIVNFILGGGSDAADLDCGDMNGDGAINVTDIVSVVNYILGGGTALNSGAEEAIITIAGNQVSVRGVDDKAISGIQLTKSFI